MWQNNKTDKSNEELNKQDVAASKRITSLFLELLEHQFPINESKASLQLRSASDFAAQLSVHVNHLNRAVKRTTSKIIAERILEEAKILLKNSSLNVSEIAYSLGFTKASHFTNFFKKHVDVSPLKFRNIRS
jgi:AraC-like DNA-binding protein